MDSPIGYLFFFFFPVLFFWLCRTGMEDLSSPTRDLTHTPCSGSTES